MGFFADCRRRWRKIPFALEKHEKRCSESQILPDKPTTKEEATRPEFKTCKYTTEAIVSEGFDKGELGNVGFASSKWTD